MKEINQLIDETGILVLRDVMEKGISKTTAYHFIKMNNFEKVGPGIYLAPDSWLDDGYVLSLRFPDVVFSHDEALYYHGLIDREPIHKTVTIYTGYGTSRLVNEGIKVYTVKKELLDVGKSIETNAYGHKVAVYDLERTVVDLFRSRSSFEIQDFQTAVKTYVNRKDKDLNRLMYYAKLFHVDRKIREYMEVLL